MYPQVDTSFYWIGVLSAISFCSLWPKAAERRKIITKKKIANVKKYTMELLTIWATALILYGFLCDHK